MNSYVTTVGLNLASNFPPTTGKRQGATSSPKDNRTVPLLKEVHVSGLAIRNKIDALNANKSMGPDNIQPKLLKLAGSAIIPSLESLYRCNIQTKTVFTSWKTAKITPVNFQKGRRNGLGRLSTNLLAKRAEQDPRILSKRCTCTSLLVSLVSDKQWAYCTSYSAELLRIHLILD